MGHENIFIAEADSSNCFGCGYCIPACPFGAVELEHQSSGLKALVSADKCTGCGTCVPACWNGAMQQPSVTDKQIVQEIDSSSVVDISTQTDEFVPSMIVLECNSCSKKRNSTGNTYLIRSDTRVSSITVSCTARIKPEFAVKAFARGIDGVLISGCQKDHCRYKSANERTIKRFTMFSRLIAHLGIDPRRIKINDTTDFSVDGFQHELDSFINLLNDLGPNPLKENGQKVEAEKLLKIQTRFKHSEQKKIDAFLNEARDFIGSLLSENKLESILALREEHGQVVPAVFSSSEDIEMLVLSPRYGIARIVMEIQKEPYEGKLGVLVRACDERGLIELAKQNKVDLSQLELIGLACTAEEAEGCLCSKPIPSKIDIGKPVDLSDSDFNKSTQEYLDQLNLLPLKERFEYWNYQFSKCIKCYACRDNCPTCVCDTCILEDPIWIKRGKIPPESPTFHMIRMYHMTQKCTGCGECEAACPVEIPLLTIQQMIIADMQEIFGYSSGENIDQNHPLDTDLADAPMKEARQ